MGEIPRADPASTPRIGGSGEAPRERAVFEVTSGQPPWKVEIIPLEGVTADGRSLNGGGEKPRALFEVRAEFEGKGLDAFEPVAGKVGRVESWNTRDLEVAKAVAIAAVDELRAGREPILLQLAGRFRAG